MTTAEQLLASIGEVDKTFIIDNDLRTIKIPADITNLGVQSDDDVMTVYFQMPRTYCGIDLSEFNIRINYLNANSEGDYHDVDDAEVQSDGTILFSWTIGRHAASVVGNVEFNVCMKKTDSSGTVIKEFNTTTASLPILKGLEISEQVISEYNDILEQWRAKLFGVGDTEEARIIAVSTEQQQVISEQSATVLIDIELKGSETLATIPDTYTEVYNMAEEALRTKADAIVLEAEGTVISVNDASDDHLQNLKLYGRTTQDGTPTPDTPVELVSVENPTVRVFGKNLWDRGYDNVDLNFVSGWGNAVWNNDAVVNTLKPNTTYTMSFDVTALEIPEYETLFGDNCGFTLFSDKASGEYIVMAQSMNSGAFTVGEKRSVKATFTTPSNLLDESMNYKILRYTQRYITSDGTAVFATVKFENIQLEFGDTATVYEPYKPIQTITLNRTLHGITNAFGNTVCDEVDLERGVYIQRFGDEVIDGSEIKGVGVHANGQKYTLLKRLCIPNSSILSDRYIGGSWSDYDKRTYILADNLVITDSRFVDVETAKTILENERPRFVYALATPIETPLTSEEILAYKKLKTNRTNTTVLNDQNARMAIAYSADTLKFLRDNQPKPTDEQVEAAVNEYADEHGVQVPNDDYIKNLAEQVAASALDIFRSNLKPAKIGEVTLPATAWVGEANLYSQVVSIDGVTEHSQVDLTPDVQQLAVFYEKDLTFVTENEDGVVTVYAIGQKPTNDYTIQVTITEVEI